MGEYFKVLTGCVFESLKSTGCEPTMCESHG